jgi:hypothetical protein
MNIFRPTLEQIKECLLCMYYGSHEEFKNNISDDWIFTVYIPDDFDLSLEIGHTTQEIIQIWLDIRKENNINDPYNVWEEFKRLKEDRIYKFVSSLVEYYNWFVILAICVENNLIVDSVEKDDGGESTIYDIEPATPRLKVRFK